MNAFPLFSTLSAPLVSPRAPLLCTPGHGSTAFPARVLLTFLLAGSAAPAFSQSTIDPAQASSWAGNSGWINWRPAQPASSGGAVVGEAVLAGKIYSANCGWIDLGDGTPANGIAYQNNSATDCGVNVAPTGALTGFAYAANCGWINFEQTHGKPKFDLLTGMFSGFAWGANIGWVNLGTGHLRTTTLHITDTDADGIGDEWETARFGNLTTATAISDFDHDGISDRDEYRDLTDPRDPRSFLNILTVSAAPAPAGLMVITFGPTGPGRLYTLEHSAALQSWGAIPGFESFGAPPASSTQLTIPAAGHASARWFFRVRALIPLQP